MSTRSIYRCSAFSPDPQLQLGAAYLAHLYRTLCRASWNDTNEMDGPLNLLFVWAWERMLCIAPITRQYLPVANIPVAWTVLILVVYFIDDVYLIDGTFLNFCNVTCCRWSHSA
ncbi:hypothetical protein AHAS_Ahas07G0041800 [Arachis hypogaea]